jgi:predicted MFS family arabinose efflux permease
VVPLWWARSDPHQATPDTEALVATKFWPLPKESIFVLGVGIALFGGMTESAFIGLFAVFGEERQFSGEQIAALLTTFGLGGLLMQYLIGWLTDHRGMVVASLVCSIGTALLTLVLLLPLTGLALHASLFGLGGLVTSYLTLALIAATKTSDGSLARNVSALSMIYTTSAIAGPLMAGAAVHALGGNAMIGCIGVFAVLMTVYVARLRNR